VKVSESERERKAIQRKSEGERPVLLSSFFKLICEMRRCFWGRNREFGFKVRRRKRNDSSLVIFFS